MAVQVKQLLPCFLCGNSLKVKQTKRQKPYFICETCGLQAFIRYKEGIRRFSQVVNQFRRKPERFHTNEAQVYRLLQLLSRLEELEFHYTELQEPKTTEEYLFGITDRDQELKTIAVEIKQARKQIAELRSKKQD